MLRLCQNCGTVFAGTSGQASGQCPNCPERSSFWDRKLPGPFDGWALGLLTVALLGLGSFSATRHFLRPRPVSVIPRSYWEGLSHQERDVYLRSLARNHNLDHSCPVMDVWMQDEGIQLEFFIKCSTDDSPDVEPTDSPLGLPPAQNLALVCRSSGSRFL